MRGSSDVNVEQILTANLPKFLWRVTVWIGAERHLDLLFDATGIAQQSLLVYAIQSKPILPLLMTIVAKFASNEIENPQAKAIIEHFVVPSAGNKPPQI
jgi:hypothetical protein